MVIYCFYCQEEIKSGQEYCSLVSHNKQGVISHEDHWHRECFKTWIEEKVDTRVKQLANAIKEQAIPLIRDKYFGGASAPIFAQ